MSGRTVFRSIRRLERLVEEAEEIVDEFPDIGEKKGFLKEIGSVLDGGRVQREREAEARLRQIFAESVGIASAVKESLLDYGIRATNEQLGEELTNADSWSEGVRLLRSAMAFLRARAEEL